MTAAVPRSGHKTFLLEARAARRVCVGISPPLFARRLLPLLDHFRIRRWRPFGLERLREERIDFSVRKRGCAPPPNFRVGVRDLRDVFLDGFINFIIFCRSTIILIYAEIYQQIYASVKVAH